MNPTHESGAEVWIQYPKTRSRTLRGAGEPMRLLVCGGRDYTRRELVYAALDRVAAKRQIEYVIHGAARGADSIAGKWAESRGIPCRTFPVTKEEWTQHGRAAGPMRNSRMLREGEPDGVVAFPGQSGTRDMIRQAETWGIPVWRPYG